VCEATVKINPLFVSLALVDPFQASQSLCLSGILKGPSWWEWKVSNSNDIYLCLPPPLVAIKCGKVFYMPNTPGLALLSLLGSSIVCINPEISGYIII